MTVQPIEWVLVIYYGPSAHRATYGRLDNTKYTKDYIQLTRKTAFLDAMSRLFPVPGARVGSFPLTYKWPTGMARGSFVFQSADRPHLKWETASGAPKAWRMSLEPSEATSETIPGDPSHHDFEAAERELTLLASRGAGQPYLMAIKLRDEPRTLHLRAYLANPTKKFAWADIKFTPKEIQELAEKTSQQSALAWSVFHSGGTAPNVSLRNVLSQLLKSDSPASVIEALDVEMGRALATYLQRPGYGLFFDPTRNHNAWLLPIPVHKKIEELSDSLLKIVATRYPASSMEDVAAEKSEVSAEEVDAFRGQIKDENFEVPDSHSTVKTRGSAQKAFAEAVKNNYGFRCAITDIGTREFLVAAHIVPWSQDQKIRLDPTNGICLSLLVDRAFEGGHLLIEDDLTIRINRKKVGDDHALRTQLEPYDGKKLKMPAKENPKVEYLQRRRALVVPTE